MPINNQTPLGGVPPANKPWEYNAKGIAGVGNSGEASLMGN